MGLGCTLWGLRTPRTRSQAARCTQAIGPAPQALMGPEAATKPRWSKGRAGHQPQPKGAVAVVGLSTQPPLSGCTRGDQGRGTVSGLHKHQHPGSLARDVAQGKRLAPVDQTLSLIWRRRFPKASWNCSSGVRNRGKPPTTLQKPPAANRRPWAQKTTGKPPSSKAPPCPPVSQGHERTQGRATVLLQFSPESRNLLVKGSSIHSLRVLGSCPEPVQMPCRRPTLQWPSPGHSGASQNRPGHNEE